MAKSILSGAALHSARLIIASAILTSAPVSSAGTLKAIDAPLVVAPLVPDYEITDQGGVSLSICYNWSCAETARVEITPVETARALRQVRACRGASIRERLQRVRIGIWQMELLTRKYVPVLANDLGINDKDAGLEGRTDCVDNATNTSTFLAILKDLGAWDDWQLGEPVARDKFTVDVHWTATLIDASTGDTWAIDSWFRPHGHLPFVSPIRDWKAGRKPWLPPLDKLNLYPRSVGTLCD
ncbi:hypothetical protein [Thiorhodococcus minor]|uniref:Uncharacterized protein n=1 Tax=Thiorhodococcus minor TaxID=57489 RepID=A0A6M0K5B1_9GAMM|nr:hypothetical protein [Thiorhodococcus minor]NEV64113.1 hypothetical protein [Thiorhodococcus minor]